MHRATPSIVWAIWAAMFVALLVLVARFGSNVPSWDEWDLVPALTGHQPVTAEWLWSQHNEHRVPLPRLVLLALNAFGRIDFRIGQVQNASALAAVAALLILAVRRARDGRTILADALFPLVLLHPRHAVNVLWGWQFQFVASAALACVILGSIARGSSRPARGALFTAGIALCLLPLCGANGVALVPALALWLAYVAYVALRAGERARALAAGATAMVSLALVGRYFVGFEEVPNYALGSTFSATAEEAVRFFAAGFGPTFRGSWPLSGVAAVLALLATTALLLWTIRYRPEERARALGLASFLAAMGSLALGLGFGGRYGFQARYVTLAAPAWCAAHLVWAICPSPAWLPRSLGPSALALAALASFHPNLQSGLEHARDLRTHLAAFEHDVAAGEPPYRLVARHGRYLHPHHELLSDYMPMLRAAGVGAFAELRDDPPFVEIPIRLDALSIEQCTIDGDTIRATGGIPEIVLALPAAERVAGFRLRCAYRSLQPGLPCIALYWHGGGAEAGFGKRYYMFSPTGDRATWERNSWSRRSEAEITLTCWIDEPATHLRLHPDYKPCELRIRELVMLVAPRP